MDKTDADLTTLESNKLSLLAKNPIIINTPPTKERIETT